jgi:putative nucleotidyltransferase with HDIG domain
MRLVLKPVKTSFMVGKPAIRDYFDEKGVLLLSKGQDPQNSTRTLNSRHLYSLHYEWHEPRNASSSSCCPKNLITSKRIGPYVQRTYIQVELFEPSLFSQGALFIDRIIQDLESHPVIAQDFDALRSYDNYTYMHSINVALLAYAMGTVMNYKGEKLRRLVLGALLHDIGKLSIPVSIINKPMALSAVQNHPNRGFQRSTDLFLPRSVIATILEHHERWNGCGYPRGLIAEDIHPYAQIVAVADVFDALVSDRPYRPGLPPYHAIEIILNGLEKDFSPDVVTAFLKVIRIYPKNTRVTLNTGESGVVIKYPTFYPTRPLVRILNDANGNPVESEQTINLFGDSQHYIQTVKYDWVH